MSVGHRARSDAPTMASEFALSVLTAERNKPSSPVAAVAPDTSHSDACMRLSLGPQRRRVKGGPAIAAARPRRKTGDANPADMRCRNAGLTTVAVDPAAALHRRYRLERREPLADQRRGPGNGHEIVEGEPDEEDQHRRVG